MAVNFSSEYSVLGMIIMMFLFFVYLGQIIFMTTMLDEGQVSKLQPFINIENALVLTWWTTICCNYVKAICNANNSLTDIVISTLIGIIIAIIIIELFVKYMNKKK